MKQIDTGSWFTVAFFALMLGIIIKATYDSLRSQRALDEGNVDTINSRQVKYVEFDGHQYVKYTDDRGGSLCHSPKCPCLKSDDTALKDNQLQQ